MAFFTCTLCHRPNIPGRDMVKKGKICTDVCKQCLRPRTRPLIKKKVKPLIIKAGKKVVIEKHIPANNIAKKLYNLFKVKK